MALKFYLKVLKQFNLKRYTDRISKVAQKEKKSKLRIANDMLYCSMRYGAGPADYEAFELASKNSKQRKTYVTRGINNKLVKKFNNPEYWHFFDDKEDLNTKFDSFLKRDWISTKGLTNTKFQKFIDGKDYIIYKPLDGCCGQGVEKIKCVDRDFAELYRYVKSKPHGLLEEVVIQSKEMSDIFPDSVNTVRYMTLFKNGVCIPLFAFLRIGTAGNCVDNLNNGGIAAKLDIKTGKILYPAASKNGCSYTNHPDTGAELIGFTVPHWNEVCSLAEEASKVVPEVGYIGWDIAIRENDVVLIEGNNYPGHDILQLPAYTPDGIGLYPDIKKHL